MTTKTEKGNAFQRWIKAWLEEREYLVWNQGRTLKIIRKYNEKTGKWENIFISTKNDIYKCIDLIAHHKDKKRLLWIQATLDTNIKKKVEKFLDNISFNTLLGDILIFVDRGGRKVDIFQVSLEECKIIPLEQETATIEEIYNIFPKAILKGKILRRKFFPVEGSDFEI